jgi:hypothetical protein
MVQRQAVLPSSSTALPNPRYLVPATLASLLVALLAAAAAVGALLYPATVYPTEALRRAFLANDVVTLVVGLPMLLVSLWLARRGRLAGLLFWPGALFYLFYNALVYLLAAPFSGVFLLNLFVVTFSVYTMIALVAGSDATAIRERLDGAVPTRAAAVLLVAFGLLFPLRVLVILAGALVKSTTIVPTELALHITDFLLGPAWISGGLLLWRREPLGYAASLGLLFQGSMLFVGLIAVLLLQPLLDDAPLALVDIVVVAVMGLIFFVPFALFTRAAWSPLAAREP